MKLYTFLFLSLCISFTAFSQTDQEIGEDPVLRKKAEEKAKNRPNTINVTDNIFMLKGMGGNIAVNHGIDGVLMIDTQFENISESILEAIAKETDLPLQFVINSHAHGDHTGGNKNFKRKGATIIAHKYTRDIMLGKMYDTAEELALENLEKDLDKAKEDDAAGDKVAAMEKDKDRLLAILKEKAQETMDVDYETLPAISFEEDMLFHYNDEDIKLIHLPRAHTKGDIIIYFPKSDVIHTGDAFVNKMYPFIDSKSGGSYKGYQKGLTLIMNKSGKNTKIIPGHGDLASRKDVAEMRQMMEIYYKKVSFAYMNNKTEDEVAQMRDFTKRFDDLGYGDGFITTERFLRSVYKAVDKQLGKKRAESIKRGEKIEKLKKEMENKG